MSKMIDREKVIKGLEHCVRESEHIYDNPCNGCPYYTNVGFNQFKCESVQMKRDALALLKEQETVVAHWDDDTGHWIEGDRNGIDPHTRTTGEMIDTFRCSWCGFYQYWKTPFCPNCGAKMEGR